VVIIAVKELLFELRVFVECVCCNPVKVSHDLEKTGSRLIKWFD